MLRGNPFGVVLDTRGSKNSHLLANVLLYLDSWKRYKTGPKLLWNVNRRNWYDFCQTL